MKEKISQNNGMIRHINSHNNKYPTSSSVREGVCPKCNMVVIIALIRLAELDQETADQMD
jgi:hypothetical protein